MGKMGKLVMSIFMGMSALLATTVTAFAYNPNTGDNFNLPLVLGIAGGALVLIVVVLMLTGKKKK